MFTVTNNNIASSFLPQQQSNYTVKTCNNFL